jgi:hypothetical protein
LGERERLREREKKKEKNKNDVLLIALKSKKDVRTEGRDAS